MIKFFLRTASLATLALAAFACEQDAVVETVAITTPEPRFAELPAAKESLGKSADGPAVAVYMAEYITADGTDEMGNVVFFNNRGNKQLGADFSPAAQLDGTSDVTYYVDENRPSMDLPVAVTTDAIDRAMDTWDDVTCSELGMTKIPYDGRATGYVSLILGYGGSPSYVADVIHNGWLPAPFFDAIAPNGSASILGVTFTLTLIDTATGEPLDSNNDGKVDVAWREIYYNDRFTWNDGTTYDVETIALHEAGHGLSQAHFGKAFRTLANGKLHFSPRAVMNASYSGVQTDIDKTDLAGHCSNWANWPNK